jgi:allophanate hydrolase subunit 1
MYNTDFDPLRVLEELSQLQLEQSQLTRDITQNLNKHQLDIIELAKAWNSLNLRLCHTQNTLDELAIRLAQLEQTKE